MRSTRTIASGRHAVLRSQASPAFFPRFVVSLSGSNSEVYTSAAAGAPAPGAPAVAGAFFFFFLGLPIA